jgi:hypothetical protein
MNAIIFFLLCTTSIGNVDDCKEKYTDFILRKGFAEHSYYLSICIKDKMGEKFNVVVTSNVLYPILKEELQLDKEEYIKTVKRSILQDKPITLQKSINDYSQHTFLIYRNDKKVNEVAKQGKDYFIKYFLGERNPNKPVEKEEINLAAIIKQLIIWNVPVKLGDDDGGFYADTTSFKCT